MSDYLSFQQVTGELGISEGDLQRMVSDGRLRSYLSGNKLVFRAEEVRDLIHRLCSPPAASENVRGIMPEGEVFIEVADGVARPGDEEDSPSIVTPPPAPQDPRADDPVEVAEARRNPKRRFGKYVILNRLGEGGMGEVYRAWDDSLGRWVAIKVMRPTDASGQGPDEESLARFQREARGAAALRHPNVVQVYEAGRQERTWYIALECVQGRSLREWLDPSAPTTRESVTERLSLFRQACSGLAAAHAAGIVHRDLKPENMLVEDGREGPSLKLADFGICKHLGSRTELTATGQPLGTWAYMSPEQAMGRIGELGPWSDVFAMGTILYELMTGRRPFREENPGLLVLAIDREAPQRPRALNDAIPSEMEAVILRCLQKEPSERYPDAAALCRAIDALLIPAVGSEAVRDRSTQDAAARLTLTRAGRPCGTVLLDDTLIMVIGRSSDSYVVLAGKGVSRQHCGIVFMDGRHELRDLGSANGTLVNGTRIDGPVYLEDGTEIKVGDYVLTYTHAVPSLAPMPSDMAAPGPPPPPAPPMIPDIPAVPEPSPSADGDLFVDESPPGQPLEDDLAYQVGYKVGAWVEKLLGFGPQASQSVDQPAGVPARSGASEFRCGACGGTFIADPSLAGQEVRCPNCGETLTLPPLRECEG